MTDTQRNELLDSLQESYVYVNFVKKDGTERRMRCTLSEDLIPADKAPKGSDRKVNAEVLPVFDLDVGDWRSFRIDSITSYSFQ